MTDINYFHVKNTDEYQPNMLALYRDNHVERQVKLIRKIGNMWVVRLSNGETSNISQNLLQNVGYFIKEN